MPLLVAVVLAVQDLAALATFSVIFSLISLEAVLPAKEETDLDAVQILDMTLI